MTHILFSPTFRSAPADSALDAITLRDIPYQPTQPLPAGKGCVIDLGDWRDTQRSRTETVYDVLAEAAR